MKFHGNKCFFHYQGRLNFNSMVIFRVNPGQYTMLGDMAQVSILCHGEITRVNILCHGDMTRVNILCYGDMAWVNILCQGV